MSEHTTLLYYKDHAGSIMATPSHSIVNITQNGTDVDLVLSHGHSATVSNTTVEEFLKSCRKMRV